MENHISDKEKFHLLAGIFKNSSEAIIVIDGQTNIMEINPAFCKITGYQREEVINKNLENFQISGRHDVIFYKNLWKIISHSGQWHGEIWERRKNGEIYPIWVSINAIKNEQGQDTHYVGIFTDITTIKRTENQLQYLAYYDVLTGLPNRLLFRDRLKQVLIQAERTNQLVAVMLLDLDGFKDINDTLGHQIGDQLLKEVARTLIDIIRRIDTVSRLSGDEFAIVLSDINNHEDTSLVAQKIISAFNKFFYIEGKNIRVTTSIGITLFPNDGYEIDTLLKNADMAMYNAKEKGKNSFQFYKPKMNFKANNLLKIETELARALKQHEFIIYFQPQVDITTERIIGSEALLRWHHPEYGIMLPSQFIPMAEETGQIVPINEWVLTQACTQAKEWQKAGSSPLSMTVNFSGHQYRYQDISKTIAAVLEKTLLEPHLLEVETSENTIMRGINKNINIIYDLKKLGVNISLHNFGMGYSSLNFLKRLPIDMIKIDPSFIQHLTIDPDDTAIVSAIISLANHLKIEVSAVGVENREQADFLSSNQCHKMQGNLFSKPVTAAEFQNILDNPKQLWA